MTTNSFFSATPYGATDACNLLRCSCRWVLGLPLTDVALLREETRVALDRVGIRIPSADRLIHAPPRPRQSNSVARAMLSNPKLPIMDEPLAALGVRESGLVPDLAQELRRRRDASMLLMVHNDSQIFEVCDRSNFLFTGQIVLDVSTSAFSEEELIRTVKSGLGVNASEVDKNVQP